MSEPATKNSSSAARTGRRVAMALYYTIVVGISVAGAAQISRAVLFAKAPSPPWATCREGLAALYGAVEHARDRAAGTEGEDAALLRFRSAVEPVWRHRDGVASLCRQSPKDEAALDAIERLRYAEEHAVRHEAGELAPLRRRVRDIFVSDPGRPPQPPPRNDDRGGPSTHP